MAISTIYIATGGDDGYANDTSGDDIADSVLSTSAAIQVGHSTASMRKGFWRFNLTAIPAGSTCITATFNVYINSLNGLPGDCDLYCLSADWDPLDVNDWSAAGTLQSTVANPAAAAYRSWTLLTANVATFFGAYLPLRMNGTLTTGTNNIQTAAYDSGSNLPYVEIEYVLPSGRSRAVFSGSRGGW
jgi:hypothetical protein